MKKDNQQRHAGLLANFDDIYSAVKDERYLAKSDRRFYSIAGAQWEGVIGEQFENKPKFEFNKIHLSIIKIISEYRNSRITVDFLDRDDYDDRNSADFCNGLYRADEQDCTAEEAYDNAFEEAVGGGMGAWRLCTYYESDEDEEMDYQRIKIEPIFDADTSVFFDLSSMRYDKADARYCYVITAMTHKDFIEEWGEDPASWPKETRGTEYDWATPNFVYVAEYYEIEDGEEDEIIYQMIDGSERNYTERELEDPEVSDILDATGAKEVGVVTKSKKQVHKYILSGSRILEDCGIIAGSNIPIVPVYGKRWVVDGLERFMGHVRLAKDAQRLKNIQVSKLAEDSAMSSTEKPLFVPEQMSGHEVMWAEDPIKNYPYLLLNPITGADGAAQAAGPIGYTKPPQVPPALVGLLQSTEQDIQDILGRNENNEKIVSNISGKAVELIQQQLDMQTYIYISNLAKSMKRCGQIWLSMAKEVYVDIGRKMKVVGEDKTPNNIQLIAPAEAEAKKPLKNDLRDARFEVITDVGPSSSTKRSAAMRAITALMGFIQDQETLQVLGAMAIMNMEGEGIADIKKFFRKRLLRMGALEPSDAEKAELKQEYETSQQSKDELLAQATIKETVAKAAKTAADAELTQARVDETKAKTLETLDKVKEGTDLGRIREVGGSNPAPGIGGIGNEPISPGIGDGDGGSPAMGQGLKEIPQGGQEETQGIRRITQGEGNASSIPEFSGIPPTETGTE